MVTDDPRGTKRTCQSNQCGERFYDLNRNPIICPICGTNYVIASSPPRREEIAEKKPVPVAQPADDTAEEGADVISLEDADAEVGGDDADDTFLEESDDSGDDVEVIVTAEDSDDDS